MSANIGETIREIRQKLKVSSGDLANAIGISNSAMSEIENGNRSVKALELAKLCDFLNITPTAILKPESFASKILVSARTSNSGSGSRELTNYLQWLAEIRELIEPYRSNKTRILRPSIEIKYEEGWLESSKELANWAKAKLGDWRNSDNQPLKLKEEIEEKLGIDVVFKKSLDDSMLGLSVTSKEFPVILVNTEQDPSRFLFTLAHELGHVLSEDSGELINESRNNPKNSAERFANSFAANFLLPEEYISHKLSEVKNRKVGVLNIYNEINISWEALVYRLHNLGYIGAESRDAMCSLGVYGYAEHVMSRSAEVILVNREYKVPSECNPKWITNAVVQAFLKGEISSAVLADVINATEEDREKLSNLPIIKTEISMNEKPIVISEDEASEIVLA